MTNDERLPVDPTDPEYELKLAEQYQELTDGAQRWDNDPVQITVRQAQKMAAIMSAVARWARKLRRRAPRGLVVPGLRSCGSGAEWVYPNLNDGC